MSRLPFSSTIDTLGPSPFGMRSPNLGFTGTSGQTPFSPANFGRSTAISNEQDSVYVENGRPRVTYTTNVDLNKPGEQRESGPEQLVFIEHTETSLRFNATTPHLNTHGNEFKTLIGLGQLNRKLRAHADTFSPNKTKPEEFHVAGDAVLKKFAFWGVQETDTITNKNYATRQDAAVTSFIAHRAITPDVWLATGQACMPGHQLWLLLRMYAIPANPPKTTATQAWGYFPYITKQNEVPPLSAYSSTTHQLRDHTITTPRFVGAMIYVGVVVDRKNALTHSTMREDGETKWRRPALLACFPSRPEDDPHKLGACLPKVEIMLRCK